MKRLICIILFVILTLSVFAQRSRLSTRLSRSAGFRSHAIQVSITSTNPEARIYFTTDGSRPTESSNKYRNQPLRIEETTVVRAFSVLDDIKSNIVTKTYFIDDKSSFPTVSIAVKPAYLFHPDFGLFEKGPKADSSSPHYGANFWSREEMLIHTEIFSEEGDRVFSGNTGMRIFGGMSRLFPQKSLAIVTRSRYGPTRFRYQAFPDKDIKKHKYLVLRNTGSDWGKAGLRDVLTYSIIKDFDLEKQSFQPAHVYINGKYWGIYNLREKVNRYFIAANKGIHKDSLHLLEHSGVARRGSKRSYTAMLSYMRKNSLEKQRHFDYISTQMDIRNFTDLQITQIYIDNQDAGGNIKYWKPMTEDGKWRWIIYDTDWGFGLQKERAVKNNSLKFHLEPRGKKWPNPPWSTFILRNLTKNEDYKRYFINRFADRLNVEFATENVIQILDSLVKVYDPEIHRHLDRWELSNRYRDRQLQSIRDFAEKRPGYMRGFISDYFDGGDLVHVSIEQSAGGRVVLNENIELQGGKFEGNYFEKIPIHLKAYPRLGYKFVRWEGVENEELAGLPNINLPLEGESFQIKAIFEKSNNPLAGKVLINEIVCNNKESGDWVELYNSTDEDVKLGGWYFLDAKEEFVLPDSILPANGYAILAENAAAFRKFYPKVNNVIGNFSFGLSKTKERLELYTNLGASIDSLSYDLEPMDSLFSLSLILPYLDNSDVENWEVKTGLGSPNQPNPTYVESKARKWRGQKILMGCALGLILLYLLVTLIYKNRHHFK